MAFVSHCLLPQLKNNFEIDPEAAEKIIVKRDDFYHALEHDIKPVSNTSLQLVSMHTSTFVLQTIIV